MSDKKTAGFRVQKIEVKNFLGIKDVEITPEGNVTCITGKNGSGKTSLLEALRVTFAGSLNENHIHNGADSAEILVDLDAFSIHRKITKAGTKSVKVFSQEGFERSKPQNYLDSIVGQLAFNPIDFAFTAEKDRNELLLRALDVEYTTKDAKKDGVVLQENDVDIYPVDGNGEALTGLNLVNGLEDLHFTNRQDVNRSLKSAKATVEQLRQSLPEDFKPFDQERFDKVREDINTARITVGTYQNRAKEVQATIDTEREQLERLTASSKDKRYFSATFKTTFEAGEKEVKENNDNAEKEQKKLDELIAEETTLRESLRSVELQEKIKTLDEKIPNGEELSKKLSDLIDKLRGEIKTRLIKKADLGIDGLEFTEGRFLVNGVVIENLSESEKLKIGLEIAKKLNADFRILCVDGVEKLDPETLSEFSKNIDEAGFQCFLTTCHEGPKDAQNISITKES